MPNLPLLCSSAILVLALAQGTAIFLIINTTKSFPPGIYLKTHGRIHSGDLVVRVNGIPLKNSARQPSIPSRVDGRVELHEEALVMSEHPLSFDGRYFGPVSADAICTPLKPLITWE